MENASSSFYFVLSVFLNIGHYRYPAFVFCLLLYSFIVSANLVLILVISQERTLHQPMFILVAVLSVNSLYGSSGFFPRFLMDLLSDSHLISRPACFTQIYIIYTYALCELTILSVMAYDRYVAVCHSLHYHRKMTFKTVKTLIFFALVSPACCLTAGISLSVRLPLCGNKIEKVYCANWNIVKLSCVAGAINTVLATLAAIITAFVPLGFILYTYVRIVVVCWKKPSAIRRKVLRTCLPHVISFVIYSVTSFSDTALSGKRGNVSSGKQLNQFVAVLLSIEFLVIPPMMNPLIYGLKSPEIRKHIFRVFQPKTAKGGSVRAAVIR